MQECIGIDISPKETAVSICCDGSAGFLNRSGTNIIKEYYPEVIFKFARDVSPHILTAAKTVSEDHRSFAFTINNHVTTFYRDNMNFHLIIAKTIVKQVY